ncbi:MAG: YicC family protein [Chitinophagaceae bacterium]|nr:YicC family protein [Chitinophagaceae bacterium]
MFYSMTGFGSAEKNINNINCMIEIRSLNGKQSDINLRMPSNLKNADLEIRNCIKENLLRGSIEVNINLNINGTNKPLQLNKPLAHFYFNAIKELKEELNLKEENILPTLLQMPDVISNSQESYSDDFINELISLIKVAATNLNLQRKNEGEMLKRTILTNIELIEKANKAITPLEKNRLNNVREKLQTALDEKIISANFDANRMEQEIILYIERLDIKEEKTRLEHHCNYFYELANDSEISKGKRLGFLLQEIGREINTIGSKANDAAIQKHVVQMKDQLEQAKEQLANVL